MIKIKIIAIGKDKDRWVTDSVKHFEKLLSRFCKLELVLIPSLKENASLSPTEIKKQEAVHFKKRIDKDYIIALTDQGEKMDSIKFSNWLSKQTELSGGRISFLIGGAYGLDDELITMSKKQLSLSPMTFSHQLVRPVLLEQLYRAFSIANNSSYHK